MIHSDKLWSVRDEREAVVLFAEQYDKVFIYGAGKYGRLVKEFIGGKKVAGYIVSDGQKEVEFLDNIPVYEVSYLKEKMYIPVVVALNEKNRKQVEDIVYEFKNKIYFGSLENDSLQIKSQ